MNLIEKTIFMKLLYRERSPHSFFPAPSLFQRLAAVILASVLGCILLFTPPAIANVDDDRYEGNIFVLFAGNGSLIPPRTTIAKSLKNHIPVVLVFYVDDSQDCKQYAVTVSRIQQFYGRAASLIVLSVDSLAQTSSKDPTQPAYYYDGAVPQTVILDQEGQVRFNQTGIVAYEAVDDVLREVFDLLPRSESVELKRRSFNEYNSELTN